MNLLNQFLHLVDIIITHADNSRGSEAFSSVCDSVCLSVCLHDKTKTAETKITKLSTSRVLAH